MSESKAIELLGEIISGQILQDRNDTFYCEWCNADAHLIDEIEHGNGCVVGEAQTYLAAAPEPDAVRQKAALADEVLGGLWFDWYKPRFDMALEVECIYCAGLAPSEALVDACEHLENCPKLRYDAIAQQQETQP